MSGQRSYVTPGVMQRLDQTLRFIAERQQEQSTIAKAAYKDTKDRQLPIDPKLANYKIITQKLEALLNKSVKGKLSVNENYQLNRLIHKQKKQLFKLGVKKIDPDSDDAPVTKGYMRDLFDGIRPEVSTPGGTDLSARVTEGRKTPKGAPIKEKKSLEDYKAFFEAERQRQRKAAEEPAASQETPRRPRQTYGSPLTPPDSLSSRIGGTKK